MVNVNLNTIVQTDPLLDPQREAQANLTGADRDYLFPLLVAAGKGLPGWWSKSRDKELRKLWMQSDHLSSAMYNMVSKMTSIPLKVEARDPSIRSHVKEAKFTQEVLMTYSQRGQGFKAALEPFMNDYYSQDNGGFLQIIGAGDPAGPIEGPRLGIRYLDSARCDRTSSTIYPVIYTREDGKRFKLHASRIMFRSSMPSPIATMNGVGYCAISRAASTAQVLMDSMNYKMEKMGSRPTRAIVTIKGMERTQAVDAFKVADLQMQSEGLRHYSRYVLLCSLDEDLQVQKIDLNSVGDHYNEEDTLRNGMYLLALAWGVDARELWPAVAAGATKADASLSHMKSRGKGPADTLTSIEYMINAFYLPPHLIAKFDYQDDEQDELQAKIRYQRAQQVQLDLASGVTNVRASRLEYVEAGQMSQEVFEELELGDGRLEDGTDVLYLFKSEDENMQALLELSAKNPTRVEQNDAEKMLTEIRDRMDVDEGIFYNATSLNRKTEARKALAALKKLEKMYAAEVMAAEIEEQEASAETTNDPKVQAPKKEGAVLTEVQVKELIKKGQRELQTNIKNLITRLYNGEIDAFSFDGSMQSVIRLRFGEAFAAGAAECGILPTDFSTTERNILENEIFAQLPFIDNLSAQIIVAKTNGTPSLETLQARSELWANEWRRIRNLALTKVCPDKKLKWVMGATEEHCPTCSFFNGRVYRASVWDSHGVRPGTKGGVLSCGGWRCKCDFYSTTDSITSGPFPQGYPR